MRMFDYLDLGHGYMSVYMSTLSCTLICALHCIYLNCKNKIIEVQCACHPVSPNDHTLHNYSTILKPEIDIAAVCVSSSLILLTTRVMTQVYLQSHSPLTTPNP